MKTKLLCSILLLVTPSFLFSQTDQLKAGEQAYYGKKFEEAVNDLSDLLDQGIKLENETRMKALFFRGMSYAEMTSQKVMLEKYPFLYLRAYQDLKEVVIRDNKGAYAQRAEAKIQLLEPYIQQNGLIILNQGYIAGANDAQKKEQGEKAAAYFEVAVEMAPEEYVNYDLLGQAHLLQKDTINAYINFLKATAIYDQQPPAKPDFLLAYAYYRAAAIIRYSSRDFDQALALIQKGLAFLDREKQRLPQAEFTEKQQQEYENIRKDLSNFELDLYLANPAKREEALSKFASQIQREPDNYVIRIAYANLLEQVDQQGAIEQYQQAITIDPTRFSAPFNLGAIYLNQGVVLNRKSFETSDLNEADAYRKQANEQYKLALPYLEQAHQIQPKHAETINALMQICLQLQDGQRIQKYRTLQRELRGY